MPTRVGIAPALRLDREPELAAQGLSEAEAASLLAQREPFAPPATSRSYASIVRANVFTVFNLILLVFGAVTLAFGDWRDALFLGVLVSNSAIGIVQEVRAKHALDRLAALVAPTATVVRDGKERRVHVEEIVVRDLVRLAPGDQVVADGTLETSDVLRLDESILTGESRPVAREPGRRGSFRLLRRRGLGKLQRRRPSGRRATQRASPARRGPFGIRARRSNVRSIGCS